MLGFVREKSNISYIITSLAMSYVVKCDFLTDSQTLCSRTIEGLGCKSEYSVKLDTFRDAVFNGYTKVRNLCRMKREKSSSFSSVFAAAAP